MLTGARRAFTLIELLIVVAIIAILAAIAVPNFLEAQVRSKVSRVKADMRSLATGIESYAVDANHYPANRVGSKANGVAQVRNCFELTTPVAYLTSVDIKDPFSPDKNFAGLPGTAYPPPYSIFYQSFEQGSGWMQWQSPLTAGLASLNLKCFYLESWGPDRTQGFIDWWILRPYVTGGTVATVDEVYDPTNGTISRGDIGRLGGESPPETTAILNR